MNGSPAPPPASPERRDLLIGGYAALAVAVHVIEAAFPSPLPGVKPGLANVVTLIVLRRHGWTAAAWVSALRVVAGSLLAGSLFAPGFWLSAAGAGASLVVLGAAVLWNRLVPGWRLSVIGQSLLAAQAHLLGQLGMAGLLLPAAALLALAPLWLALGVVLGGVSGALAARILQAIDLKAA